MPESTTIVCYLIWIKKMSKKYWNIEANSNNVQVNINSQIRSRHQAGHPMIDIYLSSIYMIWHKKRSCLPNF